MLKENVEKVLSLIKPNDRVLDVGGWACPFNRANYVIDLYSYETRGLYYVCKSQGPTEEYFRKDTWIQRDICDKTQWPFKDKSFDFSICSQTLEDLRDPLFVCSELIRVSKRGYIEVPSRLIEACRGVDGDKIVGYLHHRWFIDIIGNHIQFTPKYHMVYEDIVLTFPYSFMKRLSNLDRVSYLFWDTSFTFTEVAPYTDAKKMYKDLHDYIVKWYQYPYYALLFQRVSRKLYNIIKKIGIPFDI